MFYQLELDQFSRSFDIDLFHLLKSEKRVWKQQIHVHNIKISRRVVKQENAEEKVPRELPFSGVAAGPLGERLPF